MSYQLADVPFEIISKVCLLGELEVIPSLFKLSNGLFMHHEFDQVNSNFFDLVEAELFI